MSSAASPGARHGSPRVGLAVMAEEVVAATPGVALTDAGDARWQTVDRDHRIDGITVVAESGGRYELGLHLVVSWPPEPLLQMAEDLRRRVSAAALRDGMAEALGDVNVAIDRLRDPVDRLGRPSC